MIKILSVGLILLVNFSYGAPSIDESKYPPGYIGALNSTIMNLMTQLQTYQQYIEQAFQPLKSYDQVFPKPISDFTSPPPPAPSPADDAVKPTPQQVQLTSRSDQKLEKPVDSTKVTFQDRPTTASAPSTAPASPPTVQESPAGKEPSRIKTAEDLVIARPSPVPEPGQGQRPQKENQPYLPDEREPDIVHFQEDNDGTTSGKGDYSSENKVLELDTRTEQLVATKTPTTAPSTATSNTIVEKCGSFDPMSRPASGSYISWPWSLTLGKLVNENGFLYKCGGTLITPQYVLTSAHCLTSGEIDTANLQGSKIKIAKTYVHPDYKEGIGYNDLALIKLVEPFTNPKATATMAAPAANQKSAATAEVIPACVINELGGQQKASLEKIGGFSWTTEWKYSNQDKKLAMQIRNLYTTIKPADSCEAKYKEVVGASEFAREFPTGFSSGLICVKSSRSDICQKANGNSLFSYDRSTKKSYLIGVVVKGEDSCMTPTEPAAGGTVTGQQALQQPLPAIFTRISHFAGWISEIVHCTDDAAATGEKDGDYYYYDEETETPNSSTTDLAD